jgi:type III secretion protein Q
LVTVHEPLALRVLDPAHQAAAERLALLLERAGGDGYKVRAAILREPGAGPWWVGDGGPAVRIDAIGDRPALLHVDRITEVVTAFEAVEPLLDRIEALTGWVIEPGGSADVPGDDTVIIALDTLRGDIPYARLALAIPTALVSAQADSPVAPDQLRDVPLPARLVARAADLSIDDAGALATGDLLILVDGGWGATLTLAGLGDVAAILDPATGKLVHAPAWNGRDATLSDDEPTAADQMRALRVPVAVRLPDVAVTAGDLASLREGGTLPLGAVTAGLAVELLVGGRPIASGEIVRLGDRFAVHVDRLAPAPAATTTVETD